MRSMLEEREVVTVTGLDRVPTMVCEGCGQVVAWNPFGACSWDCFDRPRSSEAGRAAMVAAAPEAFAYFLGIAPGTRIE